MQFFTRTAACAALLFPLTTFQDLAGPNRPAPGTQGTNSSTPTCGKANSCGIRSALVPTITTTSIAASGPGTFDITVPLVPAAPNFAVLLYTNSPPPIVPPTTPWGKLCLMPFWRVNPPILPNAVVGGCVLPSQYVWDFGAYIQANAGNVALGIFPGSTIGFQAWHRDPALAVDPAVFTMASPSMYTLVP